jgi:hypothetical protein
MTLVRSMSTALCCLFLAGCPSGGNGGGSESGESGEDITEDVNTSDIVNSEKHIVINEIVTDNPHGSDWIELYNAGDANVSLSGWALVDDDPEHLESLANTLTIAAGGHLLLSRGTDFSFGIGEVDTLKLIGAGGIVADETSWLEGEIIQGTSWGRFPDGIGPFQTLGFPTPGSPNTVAGEAECGNSIIEDAEVCDNDQLSGEECSDFGFLEGTLSCTDDCAAFDTSACVLPDSDIVINEVTSVDLDFIELANVSDSDVDIAGWMVMDGNPEAEGHIYTLPEDSIVDAGGYLLLHKDEAHTFGLGNKDSITLRDSSGFLMDSTSWSGGDAAVSWCRTPDGEGPFAVCSSATPGASNTE